MIIDIKKICFVCLILASFVFSSNVQSAMLGNQICIDGALIDAVRFEGLKHTSEHVIERELLHKAGNTFSGNDFEIEKLRLQDLDLFTEISVSCENNSNKSVILVYHFQEIFRWIPSPAGKTTDRDGLMIGLALANLNVVGEDIRAEIQYRTAVNPFFEKNEYAFYASSPYLFGIPLGWNFEFLRTDSYDDIRMYKDASFLVDLDVDYEFVPHFSLLGSVAARNLEKAAFLPEVGFGFAFDYRDSKLDTRRGVYFEYMLSHIGIGDTHESDCNKIDFCDEMGGENFWEYLFDVRAYFTQKRFITGATALVRLRPGDVEYYDYFYHGGTNTFRGLAHPDSIHLGVHEAILTLEERMVLVERHAATVWGINFFYGIQMVAGFDGSLLWDKGIPQWRDFEGAIYGGVHIVIPALDRIRLEVGYSPDNGEPVFTFGLFDKTTSARWRSR